MTTSPNHTLPYLATGQAQKELTHNEALADIDALMSGTLTDYALNTPPTSPVNGATYIIGTSPTGAWSGYANYFSYYNNGWRFKQPQAGWRFWHKTNNTSYLFNGTTWQKLDTQKIYATTTWNPSSIAANAGLSSSAITATGVALGDYVLVAAPYDLQGITATAYVNATNSIIIRLFNSTAGAIDLASGTWNLCIIKA